MGVAHNDLFLYPKQVIFQVKIAISNGFSRLFLEYIYENPNFWCEIFFLGNIWWFQ